MRGVLFLDMMFELYNRLDSPRKRVIKNRQIAILKTLLEVEKMDWRALRARIKPYYAKSKDFMRTVVRDMNGLAKLGAISIRRVDEDRFDIAVRLDWPREITEGDFLERVKMLPKGKTLEFMR